MARELIVKCRQPYNESFPHGQSLWNAVTWFQVQ